MTETVSPNPEGSFERSAPRVNSTTEDVRARSLKASVG